MRAINRPRSAGSWLNSNFFLAWVAITLSIYLMMFCSVWIRNSDVVVQMAREFAVAGLIEFVYVALALLSWPVC